MDFSAVVCVVTGVVGALVEEAEEEEEEADECRRDTAGAGDVCVPMSRWNSSVGSSSSDSSPPLNSSETCCGLLTSGGISETRAESLAFSFSRFVRAVEARSWRALVRADVMGARTYLLRP